MLTFYSLGEVPFGALSDADAATITTQTITKRYATRGFATEAGDSPANDYIEGRVLGGLRLSRRLTQETDGQFGSFMETDFGEIELANTDGELDLLLKDFHADGQRVVVKIGATQLDALGRETVKPLATFATVYTSFLSTDPLVSHETVRLRIGSLAERLNDRLQTQTYSGIGGKQGTAEIAGRSFPTAFGRCPNIPAQILDPAILTYHLHGGSINAVTAVYDQGIVVPFNADYLTYAALEAAVVPAGTYASCLAEGCIRLGFAPTGDVTADIRGDNQLFDSRGYTDEHEGVIKKILINHVGLTEEMMDIPSFSVLLALQGNSMGLFLPAGDQSTVRQVLERVLFSCGAFGGQDRSGLFRVQRLDPPLRTPHWTFTDRDIVRTESGEPAITALELPYGIPWKSWGVGYQINWTVQTGGDLAGGVSQSRRQFLRQEYRYAYAQSSEISLAHRTSSGAPLKAALFSARDPAQEEAERLQSVYSLGRSLYRITVKTALFSVSIGQTVRLVYDRLDLQEGKNFVVVGIDDDAGRVETELLLFGGGGTADFDYDVLAAEGARTSGDLNYFQTVLPTALISAGVDPTAPVPPSQRGWQTFSYPALDPADVGEQAKDILIPPTYPIDGPGWNDPNPPTNSVAAFIGTAPDASTAIEIRYDGTPSQSPQFVDAFIPLLINPGFRHVGCRFEVWTEAGFDWGTPLTTGGKVGGGLWAGGRTSTSNADAVTQNGATWRNVWGQGSVDLHSRGDAYVLNRPAASGLLTGQTQNKWVTGQWQVVEYEGYINRPGFADGYARMWIDGECIATVTKAIWAVADNWMWRGIIISDAWQDGTVPQDQRRWIRNLRVYRPL